MTFDGRVALVTGAARGIGAAIAQRLADAGATVVVADLDGDAAGAAAATLDGKAIGVAVDVSASASVNAALDEVRAAVGPPDILVNNAGIDVIKPFVDSTEEEWDRIIAVNLKGPINCSRAVLDDMIERKYGRIVNIASDAGRVGSSGEAVYSATKGGVIAFTKTLARELARHGITVNCVCPGPTETALLAQVAEFNQKLYDSLSRAIPVGRTGQPNDIAPAVAFLASDDAVLHHRPDAVGQRRADDGMTEGLVLRCEVEDGVAVLTLDRPGRLNAIGSDTVALLDEALDAFEADPAVRVVVVTGEGRAFSAGADITELDRLRTAHDFARFVRSLTDAFGRLARLPQPSIAAVDGLALGGGFELALACDLRIAGAGARFGVPEVRLGLLPAAAGTQRLARLLPAAIAKHLLMTGEPLSADDALRWGLVNRIVPASEALSTSLELARSLATGPPKAMAAAKRLVDEGVELPFDTAVGLEREVVAMLFATADREEGVTAFLEKRQPAFTGR